MATSSRIGLDIGGTKIEGVSLDSAGNVEASAIVPTRHGNEGLLGAAEDVICSLAAQTRKSIVEFSGVGAGVPGQVDSANGVVRYSYNTGVRDLALGPLLSEQLGIPVAVENDVTAAAVGAAHLMNATGLVAYLNLGTGLSAGIVIDGDPVRGALGYSGEIGHLAIDSRRRKCPCGQRGCLETIASGSALKRYWPAGGEHPGRMLLAAVDAGDAAAAEAYELLVEGTVEAIRILGFTLNPGSLIIGGGLRLIGEPFLTEVHYRVTQLESESEFLAALELGDRTRVLPAESPAASVGAALIARA